MGSDQLQRWQGPSSLEGGLPSTELQVFLEVPVVPSITGHRSAGFGGGLPARAACSYIWDPAKSPPPFPIRFPAP